MPEPLPPGDEGHSRRPEIACPPDSPSNNCTLSVSKVLTRNFRWGFCIRLIFPVIQNFIRVTGGNAGQAARLVEKKVFLEPVGSALTALTAGAYHP